MNLLMLVGFAIAFLMRGGRMALFTPARWGTLHYAITLYFIAVMASLIAAPTIYDSTPFRLLSSGVLLFWLSQEIQPTKSQKLFFVHVLGGTAVVVAVLSLLQMAFPLLMNSFAEKYLLGRAAYGITIEFQRGRLLHWGALLFIFPFFYSSTLLLRWRSSIWVTLYVVLGYLSILASLVIANFRWTFLVFVITSFMYILHAKRFSLLSSRKLAYVLSLVAVATVVGLVSARLVLGYNLLDRFLLRNAHRDIQETVGRITLYSQAITAFQAYPLLGAGYGNYYSVVWPFPHMQYFSIFDQFEPIPVPIASHNEFYTVLSETGIFGFVFFLLMVYFIGKNIYLPLFRSRLTRVDTVLTLSVWISFFAIFLYVWFENIYPQNIAYILLLGGIMARWVAWSHSYERTS